MKQTVHTTTPRLLTPSQLSERIGICVGTLAIWRRKGKGPKHVKLPGQEQRADVRYKIEHVIEWEDSLPVVDNAAMIQNVEATVASL